MPTARAAYKLLPGAGWPTGRFTYWDGTKRYGKAVRAAARAWNQSGANVKWIRTRKARARVRIVSEPLGVTGLVYPYRPVAGGVAKIAIANDAADVVVEDHRRLPFLTLVIAHEMGHVMGLDHVKRGCALMRKKIHHLGAPAGCRRPSLRWIYRCRIIEQDDKRGIVRLYGGLATRQRPAFCPFEPAPLPPRAVSVDARTGEARPEGGPVTVRWTNPRRLGKTRKVHLFRRNGSCPTRTQISAMLAGKDFRSIDRKSVAPSGAGRRQTLDWYSQGKGTSCWALVARSRLGRVSRSVTATFDYRGSPPEVSIWDVYIEGFHAQFSASWKDAEEDIVRWDWNFGDGTTASGGPDSEAEGGTSHTYAAAGTYRVTVMVTDASGFTATASRDVVIEEPPADGSERRDG